MQAGDQAARSPSAGVIHPQVEATDVWTRFRDHLGGPGRVADVAMTAFPPASIRLLIASGPRPLWARNLTATVAPNSAEHIGHVEIDASGNTRHQREFVRQIVSDHIPSLGFAVSDAVSLNSPFSCIQADCRGGLPACREDA